MFCLFLAPNSEKQLLPNRIPYDDIVTSWESWLNYKKNGKRQEKEIVKKEMSEFFKKRKWETISGEMQGGSAFNLELSVPYWLIRQWRSL